MPNDYSRDVKSLIRQPASQPASRPASQPASQLYVVMTVYTVL